MPRLMNQSTSLVAQTVSNFGFSGTRIDDLKEISGEFTLANIAIDVSPSTSGFVAELKKALGTIIESLAKSPNADRLLVRVETFHDDLTEIHGFTSLQQVHEGDYDIHCGGRGTALFDAILSGVEACGAYGKLLDDQDFACNAVSFIITDGRNNASQKARTPETVVKAAKKIRTDENLESLKTILIGVGDQAEVEVYLNQVKNDAQIDQYVWVGDATPSSLAKLADFISKSVSSASQALGTGGPSQNLSF